MTQGPPIEALATPGWTSDAGFRPELVSAAPRVTVYHARAPARAGLVGTTTRSQGVRQVTYAGHPLYRYAGDTAAGQTNGQGSNGFGARWHVVSPSGAAIKG